MDIHKNDSPITLHIEDQIYWLEPENHAVLKEAGDDHYTVFTIKPRLLMMVSDSVAYAQKLAEKMIENGVEVFDDFDKLYSKYGK